MNQHQKLVGTLPDEEPTRVLDWLILLSVLASLCIGTNVDAANPTREIEPNNTMATATAIAVNNGETRGQLSSATDADYFAYSSPGGVVTFSITLENTYYDGTSLTASIVAQDGTVLAAKDINSDTPDATILAANTNPGIFYLLFKKNQYTVMQKDYIINSTGLPPPLGCAVDVDGNGSIDALTDGLLLMRAMMGLTGASVTNGALGTGATRSTWADIRIFLNANCGTNFTP